MPAAFSVPASKRSGRNAGCSYERESLPVPPSISVAASASRQISTPVPCGPYSPLCPGAQRNRAARSRDRSSATLPADCDASITSGTPFSAQSASISSTGRMQP